MIGSVDSSLLLILQYKAIMEGEASADFRDWELLVNSDADPINSPNSANNSRNFDEIEADSEGLLSWIDPGRRLGIRGGILVNSGPIRGVIGIGEIEGKDGEEGKFLSREGTFSNLEGKSEISFEENVKNLAGFEGFGENRSKDKDLGTFWSDSSGDSLGFADVGDE
ncbi:hypothetical protein GH714_016275 [Hevea brasiliensis]|uniref:Uncharacterized protein n=1 Tax=Hevea brasiliensis TaxID=3981 RepID=A0A6A6LAK0_HEVBR|nr:hypothetical protein GH714_016275 [Hevea brasiliensis]